MATADGSSKALRPVRRDREPREFIAVPVPRRERGVRVHSKPIDIPPQERTRRHVGWIIAYAAFALIAAPLVLWLNYLSDHVMSRNAMVRGQLAELGARFQGVVTKIEVEEGQRVAAGQVLARLEDRHIAADAREAQAELDGLKRELEVERAAIAHEEQRLENQLRQARANLMAAEAAVEAARSRADDARAAHKARKSLQGTGAVSGEAVRDALARSRTANAMVKGAVADLESAKAAEQRAQLDSEGVLIRRQRVGVLEAGVRRAEARLAAAQANLDGALIRAPADGAVVRRIVEPGGSVDIGAPIMAVMLGKDLWIEAWFDEEDIADVKLGSPARVTLQSLPGREFTGRVEKIGLTTDYEMPASEVPQPRTVRMRGAPVVGVGVRLENAPEELLPGLSAVVGIRKSRS